MSDFQLYLFHKTCMGSDILTIQIIIQLMKAFAKRHKVVLNFH